MKKVALSVLALACSLLPAHAQNPSPEEVQRQALRQRAVEAVIWGMSAVNYDLMLQEMLRKTDAKVNQFVYWGKPLDWHNQSLTPNPDTLYFMAFFNTKDAGALVLEIPPANGGSLNANIVTTWQMALGDGGLLGIDKGKGGKYLILPPGYADPIPDGYIPLRSDTFGGYALVRSNLQSHSDADVAQSVAYAKKVKLYPLSQAANAPETKFTDAKDVFFNSTIRYDASFFENLNHVIQSEPWLDRDRVLIDQLMALGIEKGKPFNPDARTKQLLDDAARQAHVWLEAKYNAGFPLFWERSRWTLPAPSELIKAQGNGFSDPNAYPVDARGVAYSYAYVGIKILGAGQMYMITIRDRDGDAFDGGKTYRLRVPPNAPVEQYWSATAYDRHTHTLIKDMPRASRASNSSEVQKNADGSVDIYFGAKPPTGKESNWVPTKTGQAFEVMFRLYAPTKALFEKTWVLPDIEKFAAQ